MVERSFEFSMRYGMCQHEGPFMIFKLSILQFQSLKNTGLWGVRSGGSRLLLQGVLPVTGKA